MDPAGQSSLAETSHTAVLVPQGLAVLWVHRLLRTIHTTTAGVLRQSRTGPRLTICSVVGALVWDGSLAVRGRGVGFVCDWRPADVAD